MPNIKQIKRRIPTGLLFYAYKFAVVTVSTVSTHCTRHYHCKLAIVMIVTTTLTKNKNKEKNPLVRVDVTIIAIAPIVAYLINCI